jgi:hypothetical protein
MREMSDSLMETVLVQIARASKDLADDRVNFSFEIGLGRRFRKLRGGHRNRSV